MREREREREREAEERNQYMCREREMLGLVTYAVQRWNTVGCGVRLPIIIGVEIG